MNKIKILLITLVFSFGICSCGSDGDDSKTCPTGTAEVTTEAGAITCEDIVVPSSSSGEDPCDSFCIEPNEEDEDETVEEPNDLDLLV